MDSKHVTVASDEDDEKSDKKFATIKSSVDDTDNTSDSTGPCTISAIKDSLTLQRYGQHEHCLSHRQLEPYKLPAITQRSKMECLQNSIRSLPSNWVPNKKKSKVIQKLMRKKEAEHEATLDAMRSKMTDVNVTVEEDIRVLATIYKENVANSLQAMDESLKNLRAAYNREGLLSQEHFDKAVESINLNYRHESSKIYVLIQKLKLRETHRIEQFKTFLQIAHKRLNEIAFRTPFEVQEFFVQEIQDINEITLNNLRQYQSLRLKLCLNLENETRLRLQEIQLVKLNWIKYIKLSIFSILNEQSLFGEKPSVKTGDESTKFKLDPLVIDLIRSPYMPELDLDQLYEWVNKARSIVNQIDWCARDIIRSFKSAAVMMFKSYFLDMKEIAERILKLGVVGDNSTDDVMKAEICCPAINELGRRFQKILKQLQTMWDNITGELHKELQVTFVFLNTFANLWEEHIARINRAKCLAQKEVKNCMIDGYLELSNEEANINITLDILRQEPLEKNLDAVLASTNKYLDTLVALYNANYERECKVIEEKLMGLIKTEGELHYAEVANFLAATEDICNDADDSNDDDKADTVSILEAEINMYDEQLANIRTWRSKLHATIAEYLKICKEENVKSAKAWIGQECEKFDASKRISIDILHKCRYDRTKPVLYDIRLAELKEHAQRFERHAAAIEKHADSFADAFIQEHEASYDREVESFQTKSDEVKSKLGKAQNSSSVLSEMTVFKILADKCATNLTSVDGDYKKFCNDNMATIVKSNLNYISSMRTFEEGGNFNPEEAKTAATELAKAEKMVQKKLVTALKQSTAKLQKCLAKAAAIRTETEDLLSKYKSELQYQDAFTTILKDIRADIKREVYLLKSKRNAAYYSINHIRNNCGSFLKSIDQICKFQSQVKAMLGLMQSLWNAFQRPTPEIDSNFTNLERLQQKPSRMQPEDANNLLFSFEPAEDQSFLGNCRYLLHKSFRNIESASKNFYDANRVEQFSTEDKILPTYNDFVSATLPKYIYYYVQCELLWLEETREFIKKIDDLTTYVHRFCMRSLKEYIGEAMKEICEVREMVTKRLKEVSGEQKDEFERIKKKLLALHGHPRNKDLLEKLCEEMDSFFEEKNDVFIPSLEYCTCDLEDMQKSFVSNLNRVNQTLSETLTEVLERTLREEVCDVYLKGQMVVDNLTDYPESEKKLSQLWVASRKLDSYRSMIIIPLEYKLSTAKMSEVISTSPLGTSTIDITESMVNIPTAIGSYEAERVHVHMALQSGDENNMDLLEEWKKLWNTEVEQVKKLYTVKYDLTKNSN